MNSKKYLSVLGLFCIPLFILNIHNSFSFGDDWAQYMQEALNIANGKPYYLSSWIYNPLNTTYAPPYYPPGYPLLMAPVAKIFGLSIVPQLYLNALFTCIILFTAYYYYARFTQRTIALCLAIILAYLSIIISLKGHLLSDLPCTAVTLLYLCLRVHKKQWNVVKVILLGLLAAFAMLIRTQSVVILCAELLLLLLSFRSSRKSGATKWDLWGPLFVVISGLFFYTIWSRFLLPSPIDGLGFYVNLYREAWEQGRVWYMLGDNMNYLLGLFNEVLYHKMNDAFFQFFVSLITMSSVFLVLLGLVQKIKQGIDFSVMFFVLMCFLIIITPVHQGLRYFLPAVPVFILLAAKGAGVVASALFRLRSQTIALLFLIIFLLLGYDDYERSIHIDKESAMNHMDSAAFRFIAHNVDNGDIVLSSKPRLLALFTGKSTMNFSWQNDVQANKRQFDSLGVRYLLYSRHLNIPVIDQYLQLTPRPYQDSVVINENYILYYLNDNTNIYP